MGFEGSPFAIIDVEGNGQQLPESVEIAVQPVGSLEIAGDPAVWLVKPDRCITPVVTRQIHGIRDPEVARATYRLKLLLDHAGIPLNDEPGRRHRAGFGVRAAAHLFVALAREGRAEVWKKCVVYA